VVPTIFGGRDAIEGASTGNQLSMRNLSQEALKGIEIPWPSDEERSESLRRISGSFARIDKIAEEHRQARRLIGGRTGTDTVTNQGSVSGGIDLGDGANLYDGRYCCSGWRSFSRDHSAQP
jgi:hypothetical protein